MHIHIPAPSAGGIPGSEGGEGLSLPWLPKQAKRIQGVRKG